MRPITIWLLNSLGFLLIGAPTSSNAAVLRQHFEVTVTGTTEISSMRGDNPYVDLRDSAVPPIGTKGLGSYTYDESQINYYAEEPCQPFNVCYPSGYYLGKPRMIALSDLSIDFFNRSYTRLSFGSRNDRVFILYNRTSTGQYVPESLSFQTSDGPTRLIIGTDIRYMAPYFLKDVTGTFRFTNVERVPEPSSLAIVPVVALGLGCLWHRKRLA